MVAKRTKKCPKCGGTLKYRFDNYIKEGGYSHEYSLKQIGKSKICDYSKRIKKS